MDGAEQGEPGAARLIDVTRIPLDRLLSDDDTVLVNSLRRLLAGIDRPQEILSAFENYAGEPPEPDPFR
ncbi:FXSXX-COOH protein [Actinoplanes sp. NPDC049596]|uniref:FXSXX-COOH protein n=1 Tax=unclassified Actinoplanes TaxID=2626549 RepID=UPI00341F26FA